MKWNRTTGSWVISLTWETFPSYKQMNKALNIMQVGWKRLLPPPLGKGCASSFKQTDITMFCAKFGWSLPSGSVGKDFMNIGNLFLPICYYFTLGEGRGFSFRQTWITSHKGASFNCAKFGWIWPSGSEKEDF